MAQEQDPPSKLKLYLNDFDNRLKLLESKDTLRETELKVLKDKKDDTSNLKSSYQAFTNSFNGTVTDLKVQMDGLKVDIDTRGIKTSEDLETFKASVMARIESLSALVKSVEKSINI